MVQLIDEIYAHEKEETRLALKANFTKDGLKDLCADPQAHLYVIIMDRKTVGFLLGWLFHNVFTIYWIYVRKGFRGKGAVKNLLDHLEKDLKEITAEAAAMGTQLYDLMVENNMQGLKIDNKSLSPQLDRWVSIPEDIDEESGFEQLEELECRLSHGQR